jgi:DNA polymerase III delta prime subunit
VGIDKAKRLCAKLAAHPFASAWLFVGEPGLGKTTLALALAEQMPAELHHIPSQDCTLDTLRKVISVCHYVPRTGCRMHLILVDEADQMSAAAQLYLLSKLDSTSFPPDTIFIFTCNSVDRFEERFLSRCGRVDFSSYGNAKEVAEFAELVWEMEAPADAERPNFTRLVKESTGNIRAVLMTLQNLIMLA